ncbi:MAG: 50S ribosomal protein L29 [Candidatus Portnoybacteria bacterium RIFCSPLOWO2_01_FULL_43_11]|uniref:Large ribosomal subunit protein uL29 n=4 Tax=Candidatus Portnoyibacteriota TaxID=1817913 RepID=A0A1G2FC31_9BACT|nr:MAG: 50S ribosomal protein L29 [Candidatus Portnoybacteria bacterium RIFCSPHIGHO2_01_FULL_40_12b]OGZ36197.1 MAG: 50S ribosomal protein L29 [Candidatus Portnoybacteria bacterium RIFCSPHIGHO2_02_FULL_40_23]OGZ38855.1 MAG: 50S ribosomal protein L29 [Candidatus Portnoybacteria bacterium RIFCSPLOWO2_01_FULL_43_11]OGZ39444.1 MAG: 50S ribosomal protein L29 [Candidatus Portnoybacteria bacterium RIFCSPHIGHO2_12_FULL_40_11]OGZ40531.1 MAG: 50S ribosomal protein L29 [Candidatus Portnoybacteria bacterium
MKIKEIRQKSGREIRSLLTEKKQRLGQFGFDLASKKIKNVREIRETRKDIARILTILKNGEKSNGQ